MPDELNNASLNARSHAVIKEKTTALLAAQAGVWDYNIKQDRLCYCIGAARAFGLPSENRLTGLPLVHLSEAVHPEDREFYLSQVASVLQDGGVINATFRTKPNAGSYRRLLLRGDVVQGESDGAVHASGIVVDLSEASASRPDDGHTSEMPHSIAPNLIAGIDHLIAARAHIVALDRADRMNTVMLLDAVLLDLGRVLARKIEAGSTK